MKVCFFGNHTVGCKVAQCIKHRGYLCGVVAHPNDPEDGVIYNSVYEYASANRIPSIRSKPKEKHLTQFLQSIAPDLIIVADYRYILPQSILNIAPLGALNFHPSLLPKYKGRAVLNWAIINGETEVGLTCHVIDQGMDTGDILIQKRIALFENDYIGDVLEKLYPIYYEMTNTILDMFIGKEILKQKQIPNDEEPWPARKPEDGLIKQGMSAKAALNMVRALSTPYPGAFFILDKKKYVVWRASKSDFTFYETGLHVKEQNLYFQFSDYALKIEDYSTLE